MNEKILLPQMLWQDYDVKARPLDWHLDNEQKEGHILTQYYRFIATGEGVNAVDVAVKIVAHAQNAAKGAVVLAQEYHTPPEDTLILDLVNSGFVVIIPDISGVAASPTTFGENYEYGSYAKAGSHLTKIAETARDTCQYLYTIIMKRTLYFASAVLHIANPILVGLGSAVEVAMQVAGTTSDIAAIACLNGSGYAEYIKLNKFGAGEELVMDEERLAWLSGVASVAYAKNIDIPTFVAIGTNSKFSDMDRLKNLTALLTTNNVTIALSTRAGSNLNFKAYNSFKLWLDTVASGRTFVATPTISLKVNEDGRPTAEVVADDSSTISEVVIYYSYGEYNHQLRDWILQKAATIASNKYIASIQKYDAEEPLFAYAEVTYQNGAMVSSLVEYMELKGQPVKPNEVKISRIIYQPTFGTDCFVENYNKAIIYNESISICATENGTKGIKSAIGGLKTYNIGTHSCYFADSILQIELLAEKATEVRLSLQEKTANGYTTYTHTLLIDDTLGFFNGFQLKATDFKGEKFMPLTNWRNIKSLAIDGDEIVVGNILFI